MVAVDGGNSFFVNAKGGRYEDLVTQDLVAHVEATYRVVPGRAGRALLGISMGGYAALHIAFDQPALVAAVATHSAMLLETIPSADAGRPPRTDGRVPPGLRRSDRHGALGRERPARAGAKARREGRRRRSSSTAAPRTATASRAATASCTASWRSAASPTAFELPPGDHGYEFVRARLEKSLRFLGERLR